MSDAEIDKAVRAPTKGMYRDFIPEKKREYSPIRPRVLFGSSLPAFKEQDMPASDFLFDSASIGDSLRRTSDNSSTEN